MKYALLTFALVLETFGNQRVEADSADCSAYLDQQIRLRTFDDVWKSLRDVPKQGQYETNASYENRVAEINPSQPIWIQLVRSQKSPIGRFEKDSGILRISSWDLFYYDAPDFGLDLGFQNYTNTFGFIATYYGQSTGEPYRAANSMGARTIVDVTTSYYDLILAAGDNQRKRRWRLNPRQRYLQSWEIDGTPEKIHNIAERGNLAWLVAPRRKAAESQKVLTHSATFDDPIDTFAVAKRTMLADVFCTGLLDEDGIVIRSSPLE